MDYKNQEECFKGTFGSDFEDLFSSRLLFALMKLFSQYPEMTADLLLLISDYVIETDSLHALREKKRLELRCNVPPPGMFFTFLWDTARCDRCRCTFEAGVYYSAQRFCMDAQRPLHTRAYEDVWYPLPSKQWGKEICPSCKIVHSFRRIYCPTCVPWKRCEAANLETDVCHYFHFCNACQLQCCEHHGCFSAAYPNANTNTLLSS